jgi:hypothetical protein
MLLQQKSAASGTGTFPGYGHAVNAATNHNYVKALAFEWAPDWRGVVHGAVIRLSSLKDNLMGVYGSVKRKDKIED